MGKDVQMVEEIRADDVGALDADALVREAAEKAERERAAAERAHHEATLRAKAALVEAMACELRRYELKPSGVTTLELPRGARVHAVIWDGSALRLVASVYCEVKATMARSFLVRAEGGPWKGQPRASCSLVGVCMAKSGAVAVFEVNGGSS